MAFAPLLLAVAAGGAVASAVGDIEGGIAKKNAAGYQATVAENNAVTANRNAAYASAAGQQRSEAVGERNAQVAGRIRATQGASGVDVNSGSNVDVQAGQRQAGQLDVLTTENDALLQAYGYRTQATNFKAQADLDKMEGDQAETAGYFGAGGDLLSSASSLASNWAKFGG